MLVKPTPFNKPERWLQKGKLAFIYNNDFPVSNGHVLVIPFREIETPMDYASEELTEIWQLAKGYISEQKPILGCDGFNVGWNIGEAAGQSVAHCHLHIIPRYAGDHTKPRGGIAQVVGAVPDYYKEKAI